MFWLGDAASTENQTDDIRQPAGRYGVYPVIESHEDIAASARQPGGLIEGNDWLGGDTMKNALDERLDGVKVVRMIQVTMAKGTGSMEDPVRQIQRYFDMKGNLIAEVTTDGMSYRRGTSAAICAME